MANKKKRIIYWVEHLSAWEVIIFLIRSLFSDIKINYDGNKASSLAKSLLSLFKNRTNIYFFPVCLSLDKKDKRDYALNYRMEKILDECSDDFCRSYLIKEQEYFKRMVKSFISSHLFYRIIFITMVEADSEFNSRENGHLNVIYLTKNPLNPILLRFYRNIGYFLSESPLSLEYIKYYLRPGYLFASILLSRLITRNQTRTNISSPRFAIWVEYSHDAIVDYLFWRHDMNEKNNFDIVYYIFDGDSADDVKIKAEIERQGLKYIDLNFNSLLKLSMPGLAGITGLIKAFFSGSFREPLWFSILRFEYRMWYLLYLSVFKRLKVKIFIQHEEFSWVQQPQKEAIESAGGIMVGYHWSNFPYFREPFHLAPQHVYFVWGKINKECMKKNGATARYILPSGVWIINDKNGNDRRKFFSERPNFVLSIFDSSVGYNYYVSASTLEKFYLRIIKLLESNREWGGIIKSKNWNLKDFVLLPRGGEIISRIDNLIKEKRLLILDRTISPVVVSAYADLSVCYSLNSAGIIAGAHGYRAIHWDSSGWLHHPFYKDKKQKIVFTDLDELEKAIIEASRGDTKIGNFTKWREPFNYFCDSNAAKRVGRFIGSFMDKSIATGDSEYSLSNSVKEYIAENNVREDFFMDTDWWGNYA